MSEPATRMGQTTVEDSCRRLTEGLGLDAVGVLTAEDGRRRTTWWTAPGSPPLPPHLSDVLEGRAEGWIVCHSGPGTVFGRMTGDASPRAALALEAAAPSLVGANGGLVARLQDLTRQRPPLRAAESDGNDAAVEDPAALAHERARLAGEIHDDLAQAVTLAVLELETLRHRIEEDPAEAAELVGACAAEVRRSLEGIRSVLSKLSAGEPLERAAGEPLPCYAERVAARWGLEMRIDAEHELPSLRPAVEAAARVVIGESLTNAAKHSGSGRAVIGVTSLPNEMRIEVADGGCGFSPAEAGEASGHLGLKIMRARVEAVGGHLDVDSAPGEGVRVVARLPVLSGGDES